MAARPEWGKRWQIPAASTTERMCLPIARLLCAIVLGGARVAAAGEPVDAQRITVGEIDKELVLHAVQPVRKILPPSDELPLPTGIGRSAPAPAGAWYELQANDGRVLYRRLLPGFTGSWCDGASVVALPNELVAASRTFTALVPACPEGCDLVIFSSPEPLADARAAFARRPTQAAVERYRIRLPETGALP